MSRTRFVLAAKAAVAAVISWVVAELLVGDVAYPYYAPLGALLSMNFSVATSIRDSIQAVASIVIGAGIAVACDHTLGTSAAGIALVAALGVLAAGWRRLGASAGWVPTSALFVLILSQDSNVVPYVGSFGGLTLLGMIIGLGVNLVVPAHPLAGFDTLANRLRHRLADQVEALVEGLGEGDTSVSVERWEGKRHDMMPYIAEVRASTRETANMARGNPRARRHRENADSQYAQARLLEQAIFSVEEIAQLVFEGEHTEDQRLALGASLRPAMNGSLRAIAAVLRQPPHAGLGRVRRAVADANRELRRLESAIHHTRVDSDSYMFFAGGIATSVRRCLVTVATMACGSASAAASH